MAYQKKKKEKKKPQHIPNKLPKRFHPDTDTFTDAYSDRDMEEVFTFFPSFIIIGIWVAILFLAEQYKRYS